MRSLPLPPGERGGVRGMHRGGLSRILAVRPPHPNPLPGGERGSREGEGNPEDYGKPAHPPPPIPPGRRWRRGGCAAGPAVPGSDRPPAWCRASASG
ncbi:hypothetical protein FZ029_21465 [Azospirillum sp. Sh1]|nr:hypothetical protein FZ029_21465 [Azospirillum sp. Sh1]